MSYEIRARSRLFPTIPITSPKFVYRRAGETDVQATFDRVRAELGGPGMAPDLGRGRPTEEGTQQPSAKRTNPSE